MNTKIRSWNTLIACKVISENDQNFEWKTANMLEIFAMKIRTDHLLPPN